jgi:shikimate kinase
LARHLVLIGLMGSGKTSVGKRVASRMDLPLVDGDERLAQRNEDRTAAEIADDVGIDELHRMEEAIALEALAAPAPAVIGPASSVCESEAVRHALADHLVVWLHASPELLAEKAVRKSHRPLLDTGDPVELFRRQVAIREPLIEPVTDLVVDVEAMDDDVAADTIIAFAAAAGNQP